MSKSYTIEELQKRFQEEEQWRKDHYILSSIESFYDFFRYTIPRKYRDWTMEVVYATQRVRRGYDDRFLWNINDSHAELMIKVLKEFRKSHVGYPVLDFMKNVSTNSEKGNADWDKEIDKMIAGFEAFRKIDDLCYLDLSTKEEEEKERKKLTAVWEDGMKSFVDNYWHLWD